MASRHKRDITDLAREFRTAWDVACAAVPFPDDIAGHDGPILGGDEDPRNIVLVNARHLAYERALNELTNNADYVVEPWMVTALREGIIPGSHDGTVPGSEVIAPEGVQP